VSTVFLFYKQPLQDFQIEQQLKDTSQPRTFNQENPEGKWLLSAPHCGLSRPRRLFCALRHFQSELTLNHLTMKLSKRTWGLYIIWVFFHFILLILPKGGSYYSKDQFWPFCDGSYSEAYDISEFLIYSLLPVVIIYAIKLINHDKN